MSPLPTSKRKASGDPGNPAYFGRSSAIRISPCGPQTVVTPVGFTGDVSYRGKLKKVRSILGPVLNSQDHQFPAVGYDPTDPKYRGRSHPIHVISCPVYVSGAAYGPNFDGAGAITGGDTAFVTSFQGDIRISWLVPDVIDSLHYSEAEKVAADGSGVYVQTIEGLNAFSQEFAIRKYLVDGTFVWEYTPHLDMDSFHIEVKDERIFTVANGAANHALMFEPDGTVVFDHSVTPGYNSGAAKAWGDQIYAVDNNNKLVRIDASGVVATSAADFAGVATFGSGTTVTHPDRHKVFNWSFQSGVGQLDVWDGDTMTFESTLTSDLSTGWLGVDDTTGAFASHGPSPDDDRVNYYNPDGSLEWSVLTTVQNDATDVVLANGLVYIAGYVEHDELPQGLLPALVILSQGDGSIYAPVREWGQDSTDSSDVYGLAAV